MQKELKHIKKLRVVFSIIFLISVTILFIDIYQFIPGLFYESVLYFQFIPSVLKFIQFVCLSATGFILIILITLFAGRIYCSVLCPLGTLQDLFSFISRKLKINRKYRPRKPHLLVRISFLVLFIVSILSGLSVISCILEPYSSFSRIISYNLKPVLLFIANTFHFAHTTEIYPVFSFDFKLFTVIISFIFLIFFFCMALLYGRLYCNLVCPAGTILGFLSKLSLFKIEINPLNCTRCGKCLEVCKAGCISIKNSKIDFDRCIACFNCINICDSQSINYSKSLIKPNPGKENALSKRSFLKKSFVLTTGIIGLSGIRAVSSLSFLTNNEVKNKQFPVVPPGAISINHFRSNCTACSLCITICPSKIIKPSFLEHGLTGIMQPCLDFAGNWCKPECIKCSEYCPTGAIKKLTVEAKKTLKTGNVRFELQNCIVNTLSHQCTRCYKICPVQAIELAPFENGFYKPNPDNSLCIGCGACENCCPAEPKAIFVEGVERQIQLSNKNEDLS